MQSLPVRDEVPEHGHAARPSKWTSHYPDMKFSDIASRVTGFSTPIFGVSWTPPQLDREVAERVIVFLEDRRVLYEPYEVEMPEHCIESVLTIREFLTNTLAQGGIAYDLADTLRAMRAACRKFIATIGTDDGRGRVVIPPHLTMHDWNLNQGLGELRGVIGLHLAQLSVRYGLDVPDELSTILPLDPAVADDD